MRKLIRHFYCVYLQAVETNLLNWIEAECSEKQQKTFRRHLEELFSAKERTGVTTK